MEFLFIYPYPTSWRDVALALQYVRLEEGPEEAMTSQDHGFNPPLHGLLPLTFLVFIYEASH